MYTEVCISISFVISGMIRYFPASVDTVLGFLWG